MSRPALLLLTASLFTACSSQVPPADLTAPQPTTPTTPTPPTPTAPATTTASAPGAAQGAPETIASCGKIELACVGKRAPAARPAELQCLLDAFGACQPKRLEISRFTIEGDPIVTSYTVSAGGAKGCTLLTSIDSSKDRFGSKGIRAEVCTGLKATNDCPWMETSGCAAGP